MKCFDLAVAGGGPAGLAAAMTAAAAGAHTALFEAMPECGKKLLASGNGRCNFTNALGIDDFCRSFGAKSRFVAPALRGFPPERWRAFLSEHGVNTVLPDNFHCFPADGRASSVRDAMLNEARLRGVEFFFSRRIEKAVPAPEGGFQLADTDGGAWQCRALILACGGRSIPELGSRGDGTRLAAALGHTVTACVPALAGLHFSGADTGTGILAGVSLPSVAADLFSDGGKPEFSGEGELLFTRQGMTGPAVLNLAGPANRLLAAGKKAELRIRFLAGRGVAEWRDFLSRARTQEGARTLKSLLARDFPQSFAEFAVSVSGSEKNCVCARLGGDAARKLAEFLGGGRFAVCGSDGFAKAMATSGGVELAEVNPKTLESRIVPGLFFAGETLDVDGRCGGFNIQWAVSSGVLAGRSASHKSVSSPPNS